MKNEPHTPSAQKNKRSNEPNKTKWNKLKQNKAKTISSQQIMALNESEREREILPLWTSQDATPAGDVLIAISVHMKIA